jgi:hypothetical protein
VAASLRDRNEGLSASPASAFDGIPGCSTTPIVAWRPWIACARDRLFRARRHFGAEEFWHVRIARARDDHARRAAQPPERMRRDQAVENVGYDSSRGGRCSYDSASNMPVERTAGSHSLARRRSLAALI